LFGHEGQNSLLSYLIEEDLASGLSAGGYHDYEYLSFFKVEITLTENGFDNINLIL